MNQNNLPRQSKKTGLLPGSLIYTGTNTLPTRISLVRYSTDRFERFDNLSGKEAIAGIHQDTCNWLIVSGFGDASEIELLGSHFGINPLLLEDIFNVQHLPKIEEGDSNLFITLKSLTIKERKNQIDTEQVSLFLGKNILITFQEKENILFDVIIDRLKNGKGKGRQRQEDFLSYLLIDHIVDQYYYLLDHSEDQIDLLEKSLFKHSTKDLGPGFLQFKKNLLIMRRSIFPLKELIRYLSKEDSDILTDITRQHLSDIHDHLSHIIQSVDSYREMIAAMLDLQAAYTSNRMNSIMKTLTLVSTIFIPLTFAAGIYGMNFKFMPELEWKYSYPLFLISMLIIGAWMYYYMKRKNWF